MGSFLSYRAKTYLHGHTHNAFCKTVTYISTVFYIQIKTPILPATLTTNIIHYLNLSNISLKG